MPVPRRFTSSATEFLVPRSRHLTTRPLARISRSQNINKIQVRNAGHAPHYDQPGGWLWGVPPGQKPKRESWETMWYWGFYGGIVACGIGLAFKPDTSIQTWAIEEARRRLEKEGILEDPYPDHVEE